mmetsp:Transcript_35439/g.91080  ORF Transcript_35439/g.91080 Transcript_35439/m.91080 type:complete len:261 (+) Transcript_35439:202-984(+)
MSSMAATGTSCGTSASSSQRVARTPSASPASAPRASPTAPRPAAAAPRPHSSGSGSSAHAGSSSEGQAGLGSRRTSASLPLLGGSWNMEESLSCVLAASSLSLSLPGPRAAASWLSGRSTGAPSATLARPSVVAISGMVPPSTKPAPLCSAMLRIVLAAAKSAVANCRRCRGDGPDRSLVAACRSQMATLSAATALFNTERKLWSSPPSMQGGGSARCGFERPSSRAKCWCRRRRSRQGNASLLLSWPPCPAPLCPAAPS